MSRVHAAAAKNIRTAAEEWPKFSAASSRAARRLSASEAVALQGQHGTLARIRPPNQCVLGTFSKRARRARRL